MLDKPTFILCLLVFSNWSFANEVVAEKVNCLTTHYPPFTIYRENKRDFIGRDIVYLEHIASELNWDLNVINFPWGRVKLEIEKDEFDCFFSLAYEKKRAEYLNYTQIPLHITQYGVFFSKENPSIKQKKLANKVIGVLRGVPLAPGVLEHYQLGDANIVYLDSNETLLSILHTGRVDASILNIEVGQYLLQELQLESSVDAYVIEEYKLPVYLAFRKGKRDLAPVNAVLQQMKISSSLLPHSPKR